MVEYEAKITTTKRVLYISQAAVEVGRVGGEEGRQLRLEIKSDIDDYEIESAVERLAEVVETPLTYRLATECEIEVKEKGRKKK